MQGHEEGVALAEQLAQAQERTKRAHDSADEAHHQVRPSLCVDRPSHAGAGGPFWVPLGMSGL